jgi:pimeloyl-ACP methyl ester carboxylesterase
MTHANVNGIEIYYREAGDGFPVVLVHGYTGNSRNWALTVPALRDRFRTISVDLRGHGSSAKPTSREDYALSLMADDVHGLLEQLDVRECYLAGHSMGGGVAMRLILAYPELFRALVLVDTSASPQDLPRTKMREALLRIAKEQGMEAAFEAQLQMDPAASEIRSIPGALEIWREQFLMTSLEAYIYCADAMAERESLLDDLSQVAVPALVVCGERDEPFLDPSRLMHEAIPGSELVIVAGAGHSPQFETPAEFNRVLTGFLSRVEQTVMA